MSKHDTVSKKCELLKFYVVGVFKIIERSFYSFVGVKDIKYLEHLALSSAYNRLNIFKADTQVSLCR